MEIILNAAIHKHWQSKNYSSPTLVQEKVWSLMQQERSLLAISPTGTGKTLAYLLPVLDQIQVNHQLQALILAPTQELAQQIYGVAEEWAQAIGVHCLSLIGGANRKRQLERLKDKPELIVATPGRFLELLQQSSKLKVHTIKWLVYDEADHLLDPSEQTLKDIQQIEKRTMKEVNKAFFSATASTNLQLTLQEAVTDLAMIEIKPEQTHQSIQHVWIEVNNRQKTNFLKRLAQVEGMQAIVFFDQISDLELAAAKLLYEGLSVSVLHSQLSKQERQLALEAFRMGHTIYLMTTDLAGRGLDIEAVPFVIQYDPAQEEVTYLHRSGRTGRMGQKGIVINLTNQQEGVNLTRLLSQASISVEQRYLYQSQLVTQKPTPPLKSVNLESNKKPSKSKARRNHSSSSQQSKVKKIKKNRQRQTKNIGKPKHKG